MHRHDGIFLPLRLLPRQHVFVELTSAAWLCAVYRCKAAVYAGASGYTLLVQGRHGERSSQGLPHTSFRSGCALILAAMWAWLDCGLAHSTHAPMLKFIHSLEV